MSSFVRRGDIITILDVCVAIPVEAIALAAPGCCICYKEKNKIDNSYM